MNRRNINGRRAVGVVALVLTASITLAFNGSACGTPPGGEPRAQNPASVLIRLLHKTPWHTLQTRFFCYQKSPLLKHGFESGGKLMLAPKKMRYQVDWPVESIYLLRHGRIESKTHGMPWRVIHAARSPEIAPLMKFLSSLSKLKHSTLQAGMIKILSAPVPQPPARDRQYVSLPAVAVAAFSITPTRKIFRCYVKRIDLFVNRKTGLLVAIEVISPRGTINYWFSATRINMKFPPATFAPKGKA
ncbi:MAG: hypothetical protein ACP5O1_08310 [Phycisphaerae bacterium]